MLAGALLTLAGGIIGVHERAAGADVNDCASYSPDGFCVEWKVPTPGSGSGGSGSGGSGRSGDEVVCFWQTLDEHSFDDGDPTIWVDFGLSPPPPGVAVLWQSYECSDGSEQYRFRWVIEPSPENLAQIARGRVVGRLPAPVVVSSPPAGVASIVDVPVFVAVQNWADSVTESECAGGLCVTVTALPQLWFEPGEPDAVAVECAGSGSRHVAGTDPLVEAAAPGACAHAYRLRTGVAGRPAEWPGVVSVEWSLTWAASNGASGVLPGVVRTADMPRAVEEVQTVVVGGETP